MRSRLVILLAFMLVLPVFAGAPLAVAHAGGSVVIAQAAGGGKGKPAATPTPGPPWTYQMARISIVLLVLIIIAVALLYYRLVIARQRGEV
jgi:uncharacterized BrkB/YihY/UPF0761 family membrane protein